MLYQKIEIDNKVLAIWEIRESEDELCSQAQLDVSSLVDIKQLNSEKRRQEKLATACLFRELGVDYSQLKYSSTRKPELIGDHRYVSISHTGNFVALALSNQPIGVDIQTVDERILRLRNRFVSEEEFINPEHELIHLMLHWSAKEAMFKWIGQEGVSLVNQLHVKTFKPDSKGCFDVFETRTEERMASRAYYEVNENFVLVLVGN